MGSRLRERGSLESHATGRQDVVPAQTPPRRSEADAFGPAAYFTTRTRSTVTSAPPVTISSRIGNSLSTCASSSITSTSTGRSEFDQTGRVNHAAGAETGYRSENGHRNPGAAPAEERNVPVAINRLLCN